MMAGDLPGVRALAGAAELPVPPPSGVTVVPAPDPWEAAGGVARAVGASRLFTAAEACEELDRRRAALTARAAQVVDRAAERAAGARARAEAARAGLPPRADGVDAGAVRRAAAAVEEAVAAVRAARASLGPRPRVDEETAFEAREAQVLVDLARLQRAAAVPRANRIVAAANAGALAIVAGRLVSDAFDPVFVLVAVLPMGALAVAASMIGGTVRRSRAAARRRWAALRALDVCTLEALAAREAAVRAWDDRAAAIADGRRALVRARAAWEGLVGPGLPARRGEALAAALEEAARCDADARAAERAWAQASARLQQVEDAGAPGPPVVVVDATGGARPEARDAVLRDLAARAGGTAVVVVSPTAAPVPAAAPVAPAAVAAADPVGDEPAVVDLRERVLAGLLRLRARQAPRRQPPGSVAG